jgi:hypothetical protein
MNRRKKLIEVALPPKAINKPSAREKSIRHGHPSTLHPWWVRLSLGTTAGALQREPDFGVTSVNYDLDELVARAEALA